PYISSFARRGSVPPRDFVSVPTRRSSDLVEVDDYAGLARRHPVLAATLGLFLLSLVGIPPLAGFVGKFYLFGSAEQVELADEPGDRKSTRLNSSHGSLSYAVFCLKKNNTY